MLEEDQVYCVSFDLSLAEMSRYAVPDIGYASNDRKMSRLIKPLTADPDVKQVSNKTMRFSEGLETICKRMWAPAKRSFWSLVFGEMQASRERVDVLLAQQVCGDALNDHKDCSTTRMESPKRDWPKRITTSTT